MDLGFPQVWEARDTVSLVFGALAIAGGGFGFYLDRLSEHRTRTLLWPHAPKQLQEDATQHSERVAREMAERRAALSYSEVYRRLSGVMGLLAVFCAFVAAEPWLGVLGVVALLAFGGYAIWFWRKEPKAIAQRERMTQYFREIHEYSTSTPYILESAAWAEINEIFSTPADRLDDLERNLQSAVIIQRTKHKQYVENQRRLRRQPSGDPPADV